MPRYASSVSKGRQPPQLLMLLSLLLNLLLSSLPCTAAYRVGDAVDTTLRTTKGNKEALRSQMPMFGVNSESVFNVDSGSRSFSLSFEEGLRALPWFDTRGLESVTVTFVYSRSGEGSIHAISSNASYESNRKSYTADSSFQVKFKWIEEEGVDVAGGSAVMMLATLIAAVVFFVQMCSGGIEDISNPRRDDGVMSDTSSYASYGDQLSIGSGGASMPKWD